MNREFTELMQPPDSFAKEPERAGCDNLNSICCLPNPIIRFAKEPERAGCDNFSLLV